MQAATWDQPLGILLGVVCGHGVESGREAGDIGRGRVDQHCTIQPDLVHVFQKRFGRTGELQDPIKIGLLLLHQFEGRRAQQEFERLDMNVAVGDQGTCPVLSDRSCLVGLVWYRERPQYPPTRILSRPASAVAEAKYRRGMGKTLLMPPNSSRPFAPGLRRCAELVPQAAWPFVILWQVEVSTS